MLLSRSARAARERDGHRRRTAVAAAVAGGGAFAVTGALLTIGARVMARVPLVPQGSRPDDAVIRAVHHDRLHLDATPETARPGVISLRQGGGAVQARLGDVLGRPTPSTVARPLLAVDAERPGTPLTIGTAGTNGFYWAGDPATAHGLDFEDVAVESPVGLMPAWLVRADPDGPAAADDVWAVLVHGHGATRGETLRTIPLLRSLGITSLAITYRNDAGAPESADRMHHLGADEWEDADAAIAAALARGARRIVLMGWSMGGGIALRASVLSAHRDAIVALVLDSPAVDWRDILDHHARALRAPRAMRLLALWMMRSRLGARAVRLHEPIALTQMHPGFHAEHLAHPTLLIHALEDATVPTGPSALLARLRPDLVTYVPFEAATHTREWNTDPERHERLIARFLDATLGLGLDVDALDLPVRDPAAPAQARSSGMRL